MALSKVGVKPINTVNTPGAKAVSKSLADLESAAKSAHRKLQIVLFLVIAGIIIGVCAPIVMVSHSMASTPSVLQTPTYMAQYRAEDARKKASLSPKKLAQTQPSVLNSSAGWERREETAINAMTETQIVNIGPLPRFPGETSESWLGRVQFRESLIQGWESRHSGNSGGGTQANCSRDGGNIHCDSHAQAGDHSADCTLDADRNGSSVNCR